MNAIAFSQDLKLAHYLKIGQRYTFAVQVYGYVFHLFFLDYILPSVSVLLTFFPRLSDFAVPSSPASSRPPSSTTR